MIQVGFPIEAAAAEPRSRSVDGIAVPWDVEGRVSSGDIVIFHAGALDANARPVVLRDHDRTRTVGRVTAAADDGRRLQASTRISATPLGDETLTLAGDGALMFSVGAEPTRYDYDDRGRMHVHAADWTELTLLPLGAYAGAIVTNVAASQPNPEGGDMTLTMTDTPDAPELPDDPDQPELPDDDPDEIETRVMAPPISAARGARRPAPAQSPFARVTLRQVAGVISAARTGERDAVARMNQVLAAQGAAARGIEAALADITLAVGADNIGAAYRPAYQAELVEIVSWGTPTIDVLRQGDLERGDYPNKTFNVWSNTPIVGTQTAEKTQIASGPVSIVATTVPVQTWAGGNDISQQSLDFGSASLVEDYIRAAAIDYAHKANLYAVTGLLAVATAVTTGATDSFITIVQKLIAALNPTISPPGGLFLAVSYDVGAGLIGVPQTEGPAFWQGSVNLNMIPSVSTDTGLTIYVDPSMPANTYLLGHRQGATWYDLPGSPFNLRAVNVGLLGLDVAVYGYGALGIQIPGSFVKTTPV